MMLEMKVVEPILDTIKMHYIPIYRAKSTTGMVWASSTYIH